MLDRSAIDNEAAIWVAKMDSGNWTDADESELQDWLALDPRRRGALVAAEAAWIGLSGEAEIAQGPYPVKAARGFPRRSLLAGAGAALAASIAGGIAWLGRAESYRTDLGEIRRVPLGDGSLTAINTQSEIKVAFAASRRDVSLERGEAWFQVAKDRRRPFLVSAGRIRVQAVGTAFSVRRKEGGADVLVTEGVVEAWADGAATGRIRLGAGERAFVSENAAVRREPSLPSAVDRDLAWRNGKIDMLGEPLSAAIAEFNRYNRRQIVLADPALADEPLSGVFGTDDPEGFAGAVHEVLEAPVDLSSPDHILIGRRPS